jgi:hypothetical protein
MNAKRKQHEDASTSEQPQGEQPQGEQPQGEQPQGEQPQGEQPQGEQPQGEQPQGEQPLPAGMVLGQPREGMTTSPSLVPPGREPNPPLVAYQERVIAERDELNTRLRKLGSFIDSEKFETVHVDERRRLLRQLVAMREYFDVLNERISNF